jgi:hypothetical protein
VVLGSGGHERIPTSDHFGEIPGYDWIDGYDAYCLKDGCLGLDCFGQPEGCVLERAMGGLLYR